MAEIFLRPVEPAVKPHEAVFQPDLNHMCQKIATEKIAKVYIVAEMQKAASMASVLVLIFLPTVLIFELPTHKSC